MCAILVLQALNWQWLIAIRSGIGAVRIINTLDKIDRCFKGNEFDLTSWRRYAKQISFQLREKCEEDSKIYDFNKDVVPVLNNVLADEEAVLQANASFIHVTDQLSAGIGGIFNKDPEIDIILYLGLCNGAGWATTLDGRDAVLLGIEKIIELNWQDELSMKGLIFHEIGHIWHKVHGNFRPEAGTEGEAALVRLYQEGIAMVCEQILCQDENYYHQDRNDGWLTWCISNREDIKREYLERVDRGVSVQDFFGDWCSYRGHSDVGYYLGCRFIKYLKEKYSLIHIANLDADRLYDHFKDFASPVER